MHSPVLRIYLQAVNVRTCMGHLHICMRSVAMHARSQLLGVELPSNPQGCSMICSMTSLKPTSKAWSQQRSAAAVSPCSAKALPLSIHLAAAVLFASIELLLGPGPAASVLWPAAVWSEVLGTAVYTSASSSNADIHLEIFLGLLVEDPILNAMSELACNCCCL